MSTTSPFDLVSTVTLAPERGDCTRREVLEQELKSAITNEPHPVGAVRGDYSVATLVNALVAPKLTRTETTAVMRLRTELSAVIARESMQTVDRDHVGRLSSIDLTDTDSTSAEHARYRDERRSAILNAECEVSEYCNQAKIARRIRIAQEKENEKAREEGREPVIVDPHVEGREKTGWINRVGMAMGHAMTEVREHVEIENPWKKFVGWAEAGARQVSQRQNNWALENLSITRDRLDRDSASKLERAKKLRAEPDIIERSRIRENRNIDLEKKTMEAGNKAGQLWYFAYRKIWNLKEDFAETASDLTRWADLYKASRLESSAGKNETVLRKYIENECNRVKEREDLRRVEGHWSGDVLRWLGRRANVGRHAWESLENKLLKDEKYLSKVALGAAFIAPFAVVNPMLLALYPLKWLKDIAFAAAQDIAGSNTVPGAQNQMGKFLVNTIYSVFPGGLEKIQNYRQENIRNRHDSYLTAVDVAIAGGDAEKIEQAMEILHRHREGHSRIEKLRHAATLLLPFLLANRLIGINR